MILFQRNYIEHMVHEYQNIETFGVIVLARRVLVGGSCWAKKSCQTF